MIVSSTPWGKNTQFYRLNLDPAWEIHHATWRDARDVGLKVRVDRERGSTHATPINGSHSTNLLKDFNENSDTS